MNILMIAPEPYFEPRGTPFSEYFRIKALCGMGHRVDLLTYPIGADRLVAGLTIIRCWRIFGIRTVKTGPSFKKLLLDASLFLKVLLRIARRRYDLVHTHEEGSIMGVIVSRLKRIPHLYDMHASLVQHMDNFQFSRSRLVKGIFRWVERKSLRNARSVIVICRSLFDYAAGITAPEKLTLIENFLDESPGCPDAERVSRLRRQINPHGGKLVLYTGTFEAYQGIPLLLGALAALEPEFRLALAGGNEKQIVEARRLAVKLGIEERVHFLGQRPAEEIPFLLQAADVLASPRVRGTNIPLKVYSYLKSGVPLVATNLETHTQTLTPGIAILADPDEKSFAAAIRRAAGPEGEATARRARDFCSEKYSVDRYNRLVASALDKALAGK